MYLTVHISIQIAMTRFNTFSFVLQECNDLILLHLGYLDYTYYIINIHFHGLEDQTNFNIRNIIFYVSITLSCLLYYLILFMILPYLVYGITLYCLWYRCVEKFHLIFGRKIISIHLHLHICQFFKKTMWMSL